MNGKVAREDLKINQLPVSPLTRHENWNRFIWNGGEALRIKVFFGDYKSFKLRSCFPSILPRAINHWAKVFPSDARWYMRSSSCSSFNYWSNQSWSFSSAKIVRNLFSFVSQNRFSLRVGGWRNVLHKIIYTNLSRAYSRQHIALHHDKIANKIPGTKEIKSEKRAPGNQRFEIYLKKDFEILSCQWEIAKMWTRWQQPRVCIHIFLHRFVSWENFPRTLNASISTKTCLREFRWWHILWQIRCFDKIQLWFTSTGTKRPEKFFWRHSSMLSLP